MIKKLKKAFTITELVIVIAVIAILAAVLIPTLSNVMSSANKSAALSTCRNALTNLEGVYAEDGKTASDLDGTVFVSDGYAYVFLNSSLQYVGELEDLASVDSTGVAQKDAAYSITYTGSNGTDYNYLTLEKNKIYGALTWGGTTIGFGSGTEEENYYYTGADSATTKSAESLYIYEIEVNSTTYYGFFTYEADNALYQTEAATYSRLQGYSSATITSTTENVADIMPAIEFNNVKLYSIEISAGVKTVVGSNTTENYNHTLTMNNGIIFDRISDYNEYLAAFDAMYGTTHTEVSATLVSSNESVATASGMALSYVSAGTTNVTLTIDGVVSNSITVTVS